MQPGFDRTIWAGYGDGSRRIDSVSSLDSENSFVSSLVGHWPTTEGAGGILSNVATPTNSVTIAPGVLLNGPTWVAGRDGPALAFDGSTQYVDLKGPNGAQSTARTFTYEIWFRHTSSTSNMTLLEETNSSDNTPYTQLLTATNTLRIAYRFSNFNANTKDGTKSVRDGAWHVAHVTCDNVQFLLYIDGILDPSFATPLTLASGNWSTINQATLGAHRNGSTTASGQYYVGSLAAPAVWKNRCLTATEVAVRANEPGSWYQVPGSRRSSVVVATGTPPPITPNASCLLMCT